ncbi:hypothetical protein AAFF_G00254980 [Aldrovandia affinis]|uniref:Uncharacterized protein n=1 Tax=Aldrovandia affinis TaxID=143900 RepID=A0AAD7RCN4_9TELE|nr:hypothetical protein AAFF_G00254980 [Aldrovandia affinis]
MARQRISTRVVKASVAYSAQRPGTLWNETLQLRRAAEPVTEAGRPAGRVTPRESTDAGVGFEGYSPCQDKGTATDLLPEWGPLGVCFCFSWGHTLWDTTNHSTALLLSCTQ